MRQPGLPTRRLTRRWHRTRAFSSSRKTAMWTRSRPPGGRAGFRQRGVNETEASVTLSLTRTGGTAATSVLISTTDGTAVAGVDYTGKTNEVVSFATNSNTATVTIDLSAAADHRARRSSPPRSAAAAVPRSVRSPRRPSASRRTRPLRQWRLLPLATARR